MMKNFRTRALALAGALAFFSAGAAFAQSDAEDAGTTETAPSAAGLDVAGGKLTIGGYVNTGLRLEFQRPSEESTSETKYGSTTTETETKRTLPGSTNIYAYAKDADKPLARVNLDLAWISGGGNYGIQTRLRAQGNNITWDAGSDMIGLFIPYAYGWWQPIKYLQVKGGLVDEAGYTTDGDIGDKYGTGLGGSVHFLAAGLDASVGVYASPDWKTDVFERDGTESGKAKLIAGLSYKAPKDLAVLKATAQFRSPADDQSSDPEANKKYKGGSFDGAIFSLAKGAGVLPDLTAVFEARIVNPQRLYGTTESKAAIYGDFLFGYAINDKLDVGLLIYFYQNKWAAGADERIGGYINDDKDDYYFLSGDGNYGEGSPISCTIKPSVSYKINSVLQPGLGFKVGFGKFTADASDLGSDEQTSQWSTATVKGLLFDVNPYIKFNISDNSRIEFGYDYIYDRASTEYTGYSANASYSSSGTDKQVGQTHRLYLDWLFKY